VKGRRKEGKGREERILSRQGNEPQSGEKGEQPKERLTGRRAKEGTSNRIQRPKGRARKEENR